MRKNRALVTIVGLASLLLTACASNFAFKEQLVGSWVQEIPGEIQGYQGFILSRDGKAASLNMASLQYFSYIIDEQSLILQGQSLGNGQTIDFTDKYQIVHLDENSLVLSKEGQRLEYQKLPNNLDFEPQKTPLSSKSGRFKAKSQNS